MTFSKRFSFSNQQSNPPEKKKTYTTIKVSKVTPAKTPLEEISAITAIREFLSKEKWDSHEHVSFAEGEIPAKVFTPKASSIEACSHHQGTLVKPVFTHPVIAAVHQAYNDHRPLRLTPDHIWLLISQGFSQHIQNNDESLRPKLVKHSGQLSLKVRKDGFIKGDSNNPWPEVLQEFGLQIRDHLGAETYALLKPNFTTTQPVDLIANEIVLMEAMNSYFLYEFFSVCGIPEIHLEGTVQDWEAILCKVKQLTQYDLQWWTDLLIPILEEIIHTVRGHVNQTFWRSLYHLDNSVCGGPYILGWISAFFPYLKDWPEGTPSRINPWLTQELQHVQKFIHPIKPGNLGLFNKGLTTGEFTNGISKVSFAWHTLDQTYDMECVAGFIGVRQNTTDLSLSPEIGWAIRDTVSNP